MDGSLETTRIGTKIISRKKIDRMIDKLLVLRSQGFSQQEVSSRLGLERSFISRIESVGEIRKGKKMALVGFPIYNKDEVYSLCQKIGIDYVWVMDNEERWGLIKDSKAMDFFNMVVNIIADLKSYDLIFLLSSDNWYKVAEAFLDNEIIFWEIGKTPIQENCRIELKQLEEDILKVVH